MTSGGAFSNTSSLNATTTSGHQRHKTHYAGTTLPATFEIGNSKKYSIGGTTTNKNAV